MQRVAKLMEQRLGFCRRQQRGLAGRWLGDVEVIGNHRPGAEELARPHVAVHPRTALFVVARVVVGDEQRHRAAVAVEDFVELHIVAIQRQVGARFEGDAVELCGGVEHAIHQHAVQLKVGLHGRFVDGVLLLAQLLGVVLPVPGCEREGLGLVGLGFGVDQLLHLRRLHLGAAECSSGQRPYHAIHGLGGLRGFIGHHIGGVMRVAQQRGPLCPQAGQLGYDLKVLGRALDGRLVEPLAQRSVLELRQRRLRGGVLQGDEPLVLQAALRSSRGGRCNLRGG